MARYLTALLILIVVVAHGSSVAAKVCVHKDAHVHEMARLSSDHAVAVISLAEDAAAAVDSKKGSQAPSVNFHAPVDMLPAVLPEMLVREATTLRPRPEPQAAMASLSSTPPTRPPSG